MHQSDHHHQPNMPVPTGQSSAKRGWSTINRVLPLTTEVPTDQQALHKRDSVLSISEIPRHLSFTEKYGRCHEIIHYGSSSTTRLHANKTQSNNSQLLAIKVYRHSILQSSDSSHCTSIHPDHPNILPILDILLNERSELCVVTPYCAGGDLGIFLSRNGPLPSPEADCIITQILRALSYLHKYDIAHRDIRLETILLTAQGAVKLTGFGEGHIRRMWEDSAVYKPAVSPEMTQSRPRSDSYPQAAGPSTLPWLNKWFRHISPFACADSTKSNKIAYGAVSIPYIPPEGFNHLGCRHSEGDINCDDLDPRPADVWATAMIYMALVTGGLLWRSARPHCEDTRYLEYLDSRGSQDGYPPIEALGHVCVCFFL